MQKLKKKLLEYIKECEVVIDEFPKRKKHQKIRVTNKNGVKGIFVMSLTPSDCHAEKNFKSRCKKFSKRVV